MDKVFLNLDDLTVESFNTSYDRQIIGIGGDCTGCDSGCGIAGPIYSEHYCWAGHARLRTRDQARRRIVLAGGPFACAADRGETDPKVCCCTGCDSGCGINPTAGGCESAGSDTGEGVCW